MTIKINVLYFAQLAEDARLDEEVVVGDYASFSELYDALKSKYHFTLDSSALRVARNQDFCDWSEVPHDGDEVAFIPPVAGG